MDRIVVNHATMNRIARLTADDVAPPRRVKRRVAWMLGGVALLISGITLALTR